MSDRHLPFYRHLAFQLGLAAALVTCGSFAVLGWMLMRHERQTLTDQLTLRVLSETRNLSLAASGPLLRDDPELGLHPLILKALDEVEDLKDLVVVDVDGMVVGHRDLLQVGETMDVEPKGSLTVASLQPSERVWIDLGDIWVSRPIEHLGRRVGTLVARVDRSGIDALVRHSVTQTLAISGASLLILVLLIVVLVGRSLRPLAPLREVVQRIESGDLSARADIDARNELGLLARRINAMAGGLQRAQTELIAKMRIDHELAIARDLQAGLLPSGLVALPGFRVAATYTPALEVSGDYYDVISIDEHRVALVVADVSGKGVPALVVMAMLRVILRELVVSLQEPVPVLIHANRTLRNGMRRGMFVTCLLGVLDRRTNAFSFASAGHCPPILYRHSQRAEELLLKSKPMGMFPPPVFDASLCERRVLLEPGDGLLLYTDGLTEAMNAEERQLGLSPVMESLDAGGKRSPQDRIDDLLRRVGSHRGRHHATDDLTLLFVEREPAAIPVEVDG